MIGYEKIPITDLPYLSEVAGGETDLMAEIVATYAESARELLTDMKRCLVTGDTVTMGRAAHSLKGASGSVGAPRTRMVATSIEDEIRAGNVKAAGARLPELEFALAEALTSFRNEGIYQGTWTPSSTSEVIDAQPKAGEGTAKLPVGRG